MDVIKQHPIPAVVIVISNPLLANLPTTMISQLCLPHKIKKVKATPANNFLALNVNFVHSGSA